MWRATQLEAIEQQALAGRVPTRNSPTLVEGLRAWREDSKTESRRAGLKVDAGRLAREVYGRALID